MSERPTHIVARAGDKRSLCGIADPLPVVWAPYVQSHIDGHGMTLCPQCANVWRSASV